MSIKGQLIETIWLKTGYINYNCFLSKIYILNKGKRIFFYKKFSCTFWSLVLGVNEVLKNEYLPL